MDEELTAEEASEAAELIETVRDDFGLRACANWGCGPDQAAAVREDFETPDEAGGGAFRPASIPAGRSGQPGDFTFAGLFKAHVETDPEPRSWIDASAPDMIGHMRRVFDSRTDDGDYLADDRLPETLLPFFGPHARHLSPVPACIPGTHWPPARSGAKWIWGRVR
ncbi:MAG: hypothetical protein U5R48_14260 [Gammaproteobacteria bacterium]|nr:hypothetical protein [Gammaproteobacteria bacterium]